MACTDWGLGVELAAHPVGGAGDPVQWGDHQRSTTLHAGQGTQLRGDMQAVFVASGDRGGEEEFL